MKKMFLLLAFLVTAIFSSLLAISPLAAVAEEANPNLPGPNPHVELSPLESPIDPADLPLMQWVIEQAQSGPTTSVEAGSDFWVDLQVAPFDHAGTPAEPLSSLASLQGYIAYDPTRLEVLQIEPGQLVPAEGWTLQVGDAAAQGVHVQLSCPAGDTTGLSGFGQLLKVHFQTLATSGGAGIVALQGGVYDDAKNSFSGYLTDTSGQDIPVRSDMPSTVGISASVNIIPQINMITEANVTRQTLKVGLDQRIRDALTDARGKIKCGVSLKKQDTAWANLDSYFGDLVLMGWTDNGLVLPLDGGSESGFSFAAGEELQLQLTALVYDKDTDSWVDLFAPVVTPAFTVPEQLGQPLSLSSWNAMADFGIDGVDLSCQGESLAAYSSDQPPTVAVGLNADGPAVWSMALLAPDGGIIGHWSFGPGDARQQELQLDPAWDSGDYRVAVQASWVFDPTQTTMAVESLPLRIRQSAAVSGVIWEPNQEQVYRPSWDYWVDVCLRSQTSGQEWWTGVNMEGSYAFTDQIPEGKYDLFATSRGLFGSSTSVEVTISEGAEVDQDLVLAEPIISGHVLLPNGQDPFMLNEQCNPDVGVDLFRVVDDQEQFVCWSKVARDGSYALGGELVSGTYRLYARVWGSNGSYADSAPAAVEYVAGQQLEQDIALTSPAVAGQVFTPTGGVYHPTDNSWVEVHLHNLETDQDFGVGVNEDGRYLFRETIPAGLYQIFAMSRGCYGGSQPVDTLDIQSGQTKEVDLTLTVPVITGHVLLPNSEDPFTLDDDCNPDAGVDLFRVFGDHDEYVCSANVARDGSFALGGLAEGTYRLSAHAWGSDSSYSDSIPVQVEYAEGDLIVQDIALTWPVLSGKILLPNGDDYRPDYDSWVEVYLRDADGRQWGTGVAGDGSYSFPTGIPDGLYTLWAMPRGSYGGSAPLNDVCIASDQTLAVNLRLTEPVISGYVLLPNGGGHFTLNEQCNPDAGVDLFQVVEDGEAYLGSANVARNGAYAFGGLASGTYRLRAHAWGDQNAFAESAPIDLVYDADGEALSQDIALSPPLVRGRILLPDGSDYEPTETSWTEVYLQSEAGGREWGVGVAGDGSYAFLESIPAGWYSLWAMSRGSYGGSDLADPVYIQLGATAEVNLQLTNAVITGHVRLPDGVDPFRLDEDCNPDAGVVLFKLVDGEEQYITRANVARDGSYAIGGNLPTGLYLLHANCWNSEAIYADAVPVEVDYAGQPLQQDIALTTPVVTGQVLRPDGEPFLQGDSSSADICLRNSAGREWWFGLRQDGSFLIGGDLQSGTYKLWAAARGDNNPYTDGLPVTVEIKTDETMETTISLTEPLLHGYVLQPNGQRLESQLGSWADVCLRDLEGRDLAWTSANGQGWFKFGPTLPTGSYLLYAWDRGDGNPYAASVAVPVDIEDGQTTVRDVALTMPAITGQVLQPDGKTPFELNKPDMGVHIMLCSIDEANTLIAEARLDWMPSNGTYRLGGGIAPGTYHLFVDTWGSNNPFAGIIPLEVSVPEEQPLVLNIVLTNPVLSGQVLTPDGSDFIQGDNRWVDLCLRSQEGQDVAWTGINQDGSYCFGGDIPEGDYLLYAFTRGDANPYDRSLPVAVQIPAGEPQNVMLTVLGESIYSISGCIGLPENETATTPIAVEIRAIPRGFSEHGPVLREDLACSQTVSIAAGEGGADYVIAAPLPPESFDYVVQYRIDPASAGQYPQYKQAAFYSGMFGGETVQYPIAEDLGASCTGEFQDIHLIITKLRTMAGTISLPPGEIAPPEGLMVSLYCVTGEGGPERSYQQLMQDAMNGGTFNLAAGESSAQFEIGSLLPNQRFIGWYEEIGNQDIQTYRLMYHLQWPSGGDRFGFFNSAGTVKLYAEAEMLDLTDQDRLDIELMLTSSQPADVDNSGRVDVFDLTQVAYRYGLSEGDEGYDTRYDLNQDTLIDLFDLVLLARQFDE